MSSDAARAMYPGLADKSPEIKQGSTWGVNAAEAMYGKKAEPVPTSSGRIRVPMTADNLSRVPGLIPVKRR
jgi:hypothetical protein